MNIRPNGVLLKCMDCGKQFVFPIKTADGRACPLCGGRTIPQSEVYYSIDLAIGKDKTRYLKK